MYPQDLRLNDQEATDDIGSHIIHTRFDLQWAFGYPGRLNDLRDLRIQLGRVKPVALVMKATLLAEGNWIRAGEQGKPFNGRKLVGRWIVDYDLWPLADVGRGVASKPKAENEVVAKGPC